MGGAWEGCVGGGGKQAAPGCVSAPSSRRWRLKSASLSLAAAESARLLGVLIRSAPKLVLPYTAPILRALVGKMRAAAGGGALAAPPSATAPPPNAKNTSQGARPAGLPAFIHAAAPSAVQWVPALSLLDLPAPATASTLCCHRHRCFCRGRV